MSDYSEVHIHRNVNEESQAEPLEISLAVGGCDRGSHETHRALWRLVKRQRSLRPLRLRQNRPFQPESLLHVETDTHHQVTCELSKEGLLDHFVFL